TLKTTPVLWGATSCCTQRSECKDTSSVAIFLQFRNNPIDMLRVNDPFFLSFNPRSLCPNSF
ncbi:MAG: hypothetical protein ACYDBV_08225, partial [Nitrospiria bacterium]